MDKNELLRNYANKSDDELLALYETDTLLDVAYEALEEELYNRGIHVEDRTTESSPPTESGDKPKTRSDAELTGLSGWLVLVAIGILLQPILLLVLAIPVFAPIFSDGTWSLISNPESQSYDLGLTILLGAEITYHIVLFVVMIYLAVLFFGRDWKFPRWFIGLQLTYILVTVLDAAAVTAIFPEILMFDEATVRALSRQIVYSMIWIPYMLVSRRVRLTFVRGV